MQAQPRANAPIEEVLARPRTRNPLHAEESGQSLIEFALCLPILLVIVTGIFAFGLACNNYVMLTNATSVSARQLAVSRGQTLDPCSTAYTTLTAAAPLLTKANITVKYVLNGTSYTGTSCSSSSTTSGAAGNLVAGKSAQIIATYPCSLVVFRANYGGSNCTLQSQTTELVQ